jgi:hypothetical protein
MINQPGLYQLYRQLTGKTTYQGPVVMPENNRQIWQESRTKEYVFAGVD